MEHLLQFAKKNPKRNLILVALIAVVFLLAAAYTYGYRVGPGITLSRVGSVKLTNLPKGASIIADQALREVTSSEGTASADLTAGSHTIIVGVPGDYPWSDVVSIESGKSTTVNPILVTMKPNATAFESTSTEYATALARIASTTLPIKSNPLTLANGCALVYVANNQIIAQAASSTPGCVPPAFLCANGTCEPTIVFAAVRPLTAVFAFPGRQDALVLKFDKTLYALALDPRSPQFFAPILTGTDPVPGTLSDGTIVVKNGTAVYKLKL